MRLDPSWFEWTKPANGYEWADLRELPARRLRNLTVFNIPKADRSHADEDVRILVPTDPDDASVAFRPLESPSLFLKVHELSESLVPLQSSERATLILDFANRYGQLHGTIGRHGELVPTNGYRVADWMYFTNRLAAAVGLWRAWRKADRRSLRAIAADGIWAQPTPTVIGRTFTASPTSTNARAVLIEVVNGQLALGGAGLAEGIAALQLEPVADGGLDLVLRPSGLLAALWIQFIEAIRADAQCRDCAQCGGSFVLLPGDYSNRMYCGPSCKQKAWRHGETKRAKKR